MGGAISLAQAIQELKGDFQRIVSTKGGAPCGSEPPCPTGAELRARLRLMSKHQRRGCVGMEEVGRRGPGGREGTGAAAATSYQLGLSIYLSKKQAPLPVAYLSISQKNGRL